MEDPRILSLLTPRDKWSFIRFGCEIVKSELGHVGCYL